MDASSTSGGGGVTTTEHMPPAIVIRVHAAELRKPEVDAICAAVDAALAGGAASSGPAGQGGAPFVLDLGGVHFAASLALGVLVGLTKEFQARNQRLLLANLHPDVRGPIEISRLDRILDIHPDLPTAMQTLHGGG